MLRAGTQSSRMRFSSRVFSAPPRLCVSRSYRYVGVHLCALGALCGRSRFSEECPYPLRRKELHLAAGDILWLTYPISWFSIDRIWQV